MQLKLLKKKKQCINRLQRGADALDSIKQEVMPLSYKFTLIPATPHLSISLSLDTISLSISHSLPPAHMRPQDACAHFKTGKKKGQFVTKSL